MDDFSATPESWGIEAGYHDVFGSWHATSGETQERLLEILSQGQERPPEPAAIPEPIRAFQGDGRRTWALAVQLYAVRSRRNWGHGDFTDLRRLIEIGAGRGAAAIGLNPLHALFLDRANEASPYAPNSRIFINPLYIDVENVPEFPGIDAAGLREGVESARTGELIDYTNVARIKISGLRAAYDAFRISASAELKRDFAAYRREQGEALLRFACFEVLRAQFRPRPWAAWPHPWNCPGIESLDELRNEQSDACEFQEFMQWIADRQLEACKQVAHRCRMAIGLYIDVAVGIHPDGADAWSDQDTFITKVSMGAPPDEFNPAGQDWGLAPFNPLVLAANDFKPLERLLQATMRHAGAIRLDHILALKRVFMIPHGLTAREGAYVRFPFEGSLNAVSRVSQAMRCIVIGEDLGTVPEGFRETLARWGIWSYRVMLFEREHDGRFRAPETYPAESLATFSTHDLPTLNGWLQSHDLRTKRGLDLDPGESDEARAWAQRCLGDILRERVGEHADHAAPAIAEVLGSTPSRLVVMALEDLMGALDQTNIPGTIDQYPNWRRRLPDFIEDLQQNSTFDEVANAFARCGRSI
ncbi:MAG TPA: 4-alpha-glucanotransferase [Pseudolabrys sp.]|nr:4-alpha-glucanotransferase [Pseudolabrys sp.]